MTTNTEAVPSETTSWAPDRIWLQREAGFDFEHAWANHSIPGFEEAEYVRADAAPEAHTEVVRTKHRKILTTCMHAVDKAQTITSARKALRALLQEFDAATASSTGDQVDKQ